MGDHKSAKGPFFYEIYPNNTIVKLISTGPWSPCLSSNKMLLNVNCRTFQKFLLRNICFDFTCSYSSKLAKAVRTATSLNGMPCLEDRHVDPDPENQNLFHHLSESF